MRRVFGIIGTVFGTIVLFVVAIAIGVIVHLDVRATRRLVATQATNVLHAVLSGDITIERIDRIGIFGIEGVRMRAKDPEGVQVVAADGVHASVRTLTLLRSLFFERGPIRIIVDDAGIGNADVALDVDASDTIRIANTFIPKKSSEPSVEEEGPPGRGVLVEATSVTLHHAWAHGTPPGGQLVDAEVFDVQAKAHVDPRLVTAAISKGSIVGRALPPKRAAALRGDVNGDFKIALGETVARPVVNGTFVGDIAGAHTTADAHLDGKRLDARADIANLTPDELHLAVGEIPLAHAATVRGEVHGELPHLGALAHAEIGPGVVDAHATIDLPGDRVPSTTSIRGDASARRIDLASILASAPRSDLGFDAKGAIVLHEGGMRGEVDGKTLAGRLDEDPIPPAKLHATLDGEQIYAAARIEDERMPTDVDVALFPQGKQRVVEAHVFARVTDLNRLPKIGHIVSGHATARAEGRLELDTKIFASRADIEGSDLVREKRQIGKLTASARAAGTLDHPIIDADVHGSDIIASPLEAHRIDVHARVEPIPELVVTNATVDIVRSDVSAAIAAKRVVVAKNGRIAIEEGSIAGLGEPLMFALTKDARQLRVIADSEALDLGLVGKMLGKDSRLRGGRAELHGDVVLSKSEGSGEIHAKAKSVRTPSLHGIGGSLDARIDGRAVDVALNVSFGEAGTFALATKDVAIAGGPLDASSWRSATGRVDLSSNLELQHIAALAPPYRLPISELGGKLVLVGHLERATPGESPDVGLSAYTLGLVAAGWTEIEPPHGNARVLSVAPWRTFDLDLEVDVRADAPTRHGEVAVRLVDSDGIVAAFDAKAIVPFDEIARNPDAAITKLETMPLRATLVVPKRKLDRMPTILAMRNYSGWLDAQIDVDGTARDPRFDLVAHLTKAKGAALPIDKTADADLTVKYDGKTADLRLDADTGGKRVVELESHMDMNLSDAIEGKPIAWDGSARVKLDAFPLAALDFIASRRVRGSLSGEARLEGYRKNAALHARFESKDLRVGKAQYTSMGLSVDAANGAFDSHARFEQKDGFADVRAKAAIAWGNALAPSVDRRNPVEASLQAKGFRAAAIAPFVHGTLEELDGRVDADAHVKLGPGPKDMQMEGRVVLRDGAVQIAAIGEELHDAQMTITLSPDGMVKVEKLTAKAIEGELSGDAEAKLRGFGLENATANLHVPDRKPLDLAIQGQPLGRMHGDVKMKATANEDLTKFNLDVDVPKVGVELPQSLKGGLQELGKPKDVRVGMFRQAREFVRLPLDRQDLKGMEPPPEKPPATLDVAVHVGEATITRGTLFRIVVNGDPHISVTDKTRLSGKIQLKEGKLDVQGKRFDIEKGTVTFQPEDPSNPIVVVTATWTAEDSTKVFADFVGPLKTGKLDLRSEPPRPKNEILSIILFGTADGANAAPGPPGRQPDGTTRAATAIGGGFAAQGLSEAVDDLTGVETTARIDTTHSDNPRPEIEFQIARNISVQFAHVLGTPPISSPDTNYATLDWRFKRNWSLETTFGDRGSALFDVVWQRRY
jgi:translocation and assembly module TamB